MNRTQTKKRKASPRPGAAKLNLSVDQEIGKHSAMITRALIEQAEKGNPTCLHLLIRWAEDAEFAEECISTYGAELTKWIGELEKELKEAEEKAANEKAAGASPQASALSPKPASNNALSS